MTFSQFAWVAGGVMLVCGLAFSAFGEKFGKFQNRLVNDKPKLPKSPKVNYVPGMRLGKWVFLIGGAALLIAAAISSI